MSMTRSEVLRALADDRMVQFKYGGMWLEPGKEAYGELLPGFFEEERWRIKPKPRVVPLGPDEVRPGAVFRSPAWGDGCWAMVCGVNSDGIVDAGELTHNWLAMQNHYEISHDGGKTWGRCEKEEKG